MLGGAGEGEGGFPSTGRSTDSDLPGTETGSSCTTRGSRSSFRPRRKPGNELNIFGEGGPGKLTSTGDSASGFRLVGGSGTGGGLVMAGGVGRFIKAGRGDMGVVRNLMGGPAGVGEEEPGGVGDRGRSFREEVATSRDALEISIVGDNKDNLAKLMEGEEIDVGDVGADVFFVFFDLRRGGTGGGGMMGGAWSISRCSSSVPLASSPRVSLGVVSSTVR